MSDRKLTGADVQREVEAALKTQKSIQMKAWRLRGHQSALNAKADNYARRRAEARVREAHRAEFEQYVAEERAAAGLPPVNKAMSRRAAS